MIEAVNDGYQVVVPRDAVAGVPESYAADVLRFSVAPIARVAMSSEITFHG